MSDESLFEGEEQPHLLLVDDDPTFTRVMARAMSRRGLRVSTASSAEEGLALAKDDLPDYAVVDLKMEATPVWCCCPSCWSWTPRCVW